MARSHQERRDQPDLTNLTKEKQEYMTQAENGHQEEPTRVSFAEHVATMTVLRSKMEALTLLAEAFGEQQETTGLLASAVTLADISKDILGVTNSTLIHPQDPTPEDTQIAVKAQLAEKISTLYERNDKIRIADIKRTEPTGEEAETVAVAAVLIGCLVNADAAQRATSIMEDSNIPPLIRWDFFALGQYLADHLPRPANVREMLQEPGVRKTPALQDTMEDQFGDLENIASRTRTELAAASRALCRDSGLHHVSDGLLDRPGLLRTLACQDFDHRDHFLSAELGAPHDNFQDAVMVVHNGRRHVLLVGEKLPRGFPASGADAIGLDLLSAILDPNPAIQNVDWDALRDKAVELIAKAEQGLHTE